MDTHVMSRRTYLTLKAMENGAGMAMAAEAVASTAIEHPEWDMKETRTYMEWEKG